MKGTTNATQQTLFGEILNLRLVTNLSSHEDLIGATVKINSLTYTWNGLDITVEIPAMTTYTIEVSEVEGYRTPEVLTINSLIGNVNNVTLSYDCELVTVNVSDSDGNTLDSSNVTINGKSGNKVPYGETYTVVANAIVGYTAPESLTYTANLPLRTVNIVYLAKLMGVFIEDIDGNLYTEAEWDGSKTANGIAVLTDNCEFVMALYDNNRHSSVNDGTLWYWENLGLIDGITTTTSKNEAIVDYDGEILTEIALTLSVSTNYAFHACYGSNNYGINFPNGNNGYLGAAGEWQAVIDNKAAIASALSKCGGSALSNFYWTSTQYDANKAWYIYWPDGSINTWSKNSDTCHVRAFASLSLNDSVTTFRVKGYVFRVEKGMTWEQWVNSSYNVPLSVADNATFSIENGLVMMFSGSIGTCKVMLNNQQVKSSDFIELKVNYDILSTANYD